MVYLTAAVVVVGLLCLLDLVLTFGVIRRLREHTSLLSQVQLGGPAGIGAPVGSRVTDFTATTADREVVSRQSLAARTLVGFFSPGCQPCAEELPGFIERARSMPGGPEHVLSVVSGDAAEASEYVSSLSPVAQVVVEEPGGPVQTAFRVAGFPALFLVDHGGVVAAAGTSVATLETTAAGV